MKVATHATGLPPELARVPFGVVRPRDARAVYANPAAELKRLATRGLLRRLVGPYYAIVPPGSVDQEWEPTLEAAAYGIAAAAQGAEHVALMGVSAARLHGAVPRASAVAVVAVPTQKPAVRLLDRDARVRFVRRDTQRLDLEGMRTDLGWAYVTGVEQTILDLAQPRTAELGERDAGEAVRILWHRADTERLEELAARQRLGAALHRARTWVERSGA